MKTKTIIFEDPLAVNFKEGTENVLSAMRELINVGIITGISVSYNDIREQSVSSVLKKHGIESYD